MTDLFRPISYSRLACDAAGFSDEIGASFRETGFAVIADHPVPEQTIAEANAAMQAFFALPADVKAKYDDSQGGGQRGYTAFGAENAKGKAEADQKEFWHTGREAPAGSGLEGVMRPTPSVPEVPEFDDATRALYDALDEMGRKLLHSIALHLGLEENWFDDKVAMGNSILRLLHYPPQRAAPPEGSVRAGAHEDINVITLLLGAEEAGLQVKHRSGDWLDINPPPGALVINVGDMLQRLTGGILPSTTHRVLNPTPERAKFPRYSTPFFLHFAPDVLIDPLPQCLAEGGTAFPAITAQDYLLERLREIGLIKN
ncbi:MAG: isopenicillin N synthase family oxygenase [Hyphomonadaceae bacterium]|nr:isopenicillin N synthase family oxygenase [Hyphomonadaceae bacterium]